MAATDFLSCDWGTTSFRLRRVSGAERRIVREIRESSGIKTMLERAGAARAMPDRPEVFAAFLATKLHQLLGNEAPPRTQVPIVISGMTSSSVGWRELPYAGVPFAIDGSGLISHTLEWNSPAWVGPTHLLSGVASPNDMMRGEECEIIGLMSLPELAQHRRGCLLILPGTHSKHVRIEDSRIVDWRTFMTGELFEVLGKHSLLRATLDLEARPQPLAGEHRSAFVSGVQTVQDIGLAAALFRARSRAVLKSTSPAENTAFFSGLLIGSELMGLFPGTREPAVILAGTGALAEYYACALDTMTGAPKGWQQLAPEEVDVAVATAHGIFLDRSAGWGR